MAHIVIIDIADSPCFPVIRDTGRRGYYSNGSVFYPGGKNEKADRIPSCFVTLPGRFSSFAGMYL